MLEAQIQRYGRQILLREVGGRGQRKLLARPVRLVLKGPPSEAMSVAVAYLVGGGTRVLADAEFTGFLSGVTLEQFNPDTGPVAAPFLVISDAVVAGFAGTQVIVDGGVRWGACSDCLALNDLAPSDDPVTLGSLAALIFQRIALDLAEASGAVVFNDGAPRTTDFQTCAQHPKSETNS